MLTPVSANILIARLSLSITVNVSDEDTIAAYKQKLREQLAADNDFQKNTANQSFNLVISGLQDKDDQLLLAQINRHGSVNIDIVTCAPEAVDVVEPAANATPFRTNSYHVMQQHGLSQITPSPITINPLVTETADSDDLDSGYTSDDHHEISGSNYSDSDSEQSASLSPSPAATLSAPNARPIPTVDAKPLKTTTISAAPNSVEAKTSLSIWWDRLANWLWSSSDTKASASPVTTIAKNDMSHHSMVRGLAQKDINYKPLTLDAAQSAVYRHPVAPVITSAAPINSNSPTDGQLAIFHSEVKSNELKEFHTALNDVFTLCSLNQFGGLKQEVPSGIRFMQDWLNCWTNSSDPNNTAWSTLKIIGNKANNKQSGFSFTFESAYNCFKKLFSRDEYVASIYAALGELANCANLNDTKKLSAITTKLKQLYTTQQQKISEAQIALQKEEAEAAKFSLL